VWGEGVHVWVASTGCGGIQFYEGVQDFVGKYGMVSLRWLPSACSMCIWNLTIDFSH